ncbi:MAG: hypothetical protein DMG06_03615 [Acidobacteria bacterium]|nr:MAG: hypothetical protein DMG06_03615 [Acidobacteriota bacterium]
MSVIIQPYTEEVTESVVEFNRRVSPANVPFQVPETPVAPWLPTVDGRKIYQEIFLAVEEGCVRGAYTFKHQEFSVGGCIREIGMCRMPISEGVVDKRYGRVGVMLVSDALRRQPLLYGLGMGSFDAVITRMVQAMGFRLRVIPFFFKVRNGFQFLKNIQYLKTTRFRQFLFDAAAYSGLGWAGASMADALLTRNGHGEIVTAEQVGEFSAWADEVWDRCKDAYSMVAVRDASVLKILYPSDDLRFIRLKIIEGQRVAGWAVLLDTMMSDSKYFGNMRVGSIVDCLALPEDANKVIAVAARLLERRGVDLLLSNQSHPGWGRALKRAGFINGPSNFLFVTSKPLTKLLDEIDPKGNGIHLNRGDGDGPIHL